MSIEGTRRNACCKYENDVISYQKDERIVFGKMVIKEKNNLCIPIPWISNSLFAYSYEGDSRDWDVANGIYSKASIYEITLAGNKHISDVEIKNNKIHLKIKPEQALFIELFK